ncbi:reverse transcriptase domain-containing protein [Kaistia defluvii]|uniref:reverse transcriptase domain-containing protein n=1 Tax=Kaistia defluvii TaxID=410841 RepID=UPI002256771C|nr:reverse transcriptase domain-containing protein [Kaistia defluvii]MCX5519680.1 reverse transcriptase domain-containing protein [Kaistia defluvii]
MPNFFWTQENPPNFGLPIELKSRQSFLEHLNISSAELKKIWWFSHRMYTRFEIPKRSGGMRAIFAPNKRLKHLQGKLHHLLETIYKARHPVHGFVKDRSVKTNAQEHVGRHHLLNLDLENFFPSISEKRVTGLFLSLGMDTETAQAAARIACFRGHLPQGPPASPIISNMICYRMDRELMRYCKERKIRYSRYADDITLSMYSRPNLMVLGESLLAGSLKLDALDPALRAIIANNGFTINETKIRYSDKNSRQKVTGCIVNEFVNVPRTFVREVRAMLYSVEKSGMAGAQAKLAGKSHGTGHIENVLRGKIAWLGQVKGKSDPIFRKYANRYNAIFTSTKIKVEPTAREKVERSVWVVEYCYDKDNEVQIE